VLGIPTGICALMITVFSLGPFVVGTAISTNVTPYRRGRVDLTRLRIRFCRSQHPSSRSTTLFGHCPQGLPIGKACYSVALEARSVRSSAKRWSNPARAGKKGAKRRWHDEYREISERSNAAARRRRSILATEANRIRDGIIMNANANNPGRISGNLVC
jgi:hypothetical protein